MSPRGVRPTDRLTVAFIVPFAATMLVQAGSVGAWPWLLAADALVVVLVALVARLPEKGAFAEFVGGGYPLLLVLAFYTQLGVVQLDAARLQDALVQRWELALFGEHVSRVWWQRMPDAALSFVLHLCYGSYYWILAGVPLWLWFRGKREAYERSAFLISLSLFASYLIFAVFPVAGPNYLFPLPTGPTVEVWPARYVYALLGAGSAMGTAFPSSHVAASWVAAYSLWGAERRTALLLAPVVLGLAVGTVYGQFHYAVDALAGAALALLVMGLGDRLRRALDRPARGAAPTR